MSGFQRYAMVPVELPRGRSPNRTRPPSVGRFRAPSVGRSGRFDEEDAVPQMSHNYTEHSKVNSTFAAEHNAMDFERMLYAAVDDIIGAVNSKDEERIEKFKRGHAFWALANAKLKGFVWPVPEEKARKTRLDNLDNFRREKK